MGSPALARAKKKTQQTRASRPPAPRPAASPRALARRQRLARLHGLTLNCGGEGKGQGKEGQRKKHEQV